MYCTKCGKQNADDRLFCGFCGSPLDAPEQAPSPEDAERKLYGRPEPAPAVGAMETGAEKAARAEAQSEASLSRRARRERQAEAAAREAAARGGGRMAGAGHRTAHRAANAGKARAGGAHAHPFRGDTAPRGG